MFEVQFNQHVPNGVLNKRLLGWILLDLPHLPSTETLHSTGQYPGTKENPSPYLPQNPVAQLQYSLYLASCKTGIPLPEDGQKSIHCYPTLYARRPIGGPGKIVEIDESMIGKRKYNRGRLVKGKWILGGVERGSGECFLVECENNHRDHHTLTRLIKQHVRPGTVIITDGWRGYVHLCRVSQTCKESFLSLSLI